MTSTVISQSTVKISYRWSDTHTQPFKRLLSGTTQVGRYQKKHSHPLTPNLINLSRSSLVLDPELHTPYISSPNHHHLFAAHAHTNVAGSAAKPILCHLYLVSLSASYLGVLSFSLMPHIYLTVLISGGVSEQLKNINTLQTTQCHKNWTIWGVMQLPPW